MKESQLKITLDWLNLSFHDFKLWHRNQTYSVDGQGENVYPLRHVKLFLKLNC